MNKTSSGSLKTSRAKTAPKAAVAKPGPKRNIQDSSDLIRVNFDITRAEHTKLKIYAAKTGVSMADILRSFVTKLKLTAVK
ncbi:MAG: chromosome partitioning protein ParB [Deltaproteobacteria bacterium]|jgi:hypothetical protein|nr:chromosome partitioning protein ParB [Deltaproteobacteria bacterium]MDR1297955.1 chromosome partitioning protein ParB [Deltaproteobacteria bacterium]